MKRPWIMRAGTERSDYAPLECSEQDNRSFVYFLGNQAGTRIKVGWSGQDDWRRIQHHKRGDVFGEGGDLVVLAVVRATKQCESAIHKYFEDAWIPNLKTEEIFRAESLIPYVTWLRDQYFVSTTEIEFHSAIGRKVMEPTAWLPSDGRISYRRSETTLLQYADPWAILPSRSMTGDDWYTPEDILEPARDALGGVIDLDPAGHVWANEMVKARRFFTLDEDGLKQPWYGRVWLNPPFSTWPQWVEKVLAEATRVDAIVMLGATRTLTAQYFHALLSRVDGFTVIKGRRPFWGINTDGSSPPDGFFLLYIGPDVDRFVRATASLGAPFNNALRR